MPPPRYAVWENWPRGVIPVGNAVAVIELIGGGSIGLALQSEDLAVGVILCDPLDDLLREYRGSA